MSQDKVAQFPAADEFGGLAFPLNMDNSTQQRNNNDIPRLAPRFKRRRSQSFS